MIIDISDDGYKVTIIFEEGKKEINTTIDELVDCYLEKIDKNFFDRKTCFDCESKQRNAEWIIKQDRDGKTYGQCSRCGMKNYAGATVYCPDCGAPMKGENNAELD